MAKKTISGWGLYPQGECTPHRPEKYSQIPLPGKSCIARGLGRSYGDAAIHTDDHVVFMERLNRLLDLQLEMGIIRVEAGATLKEILEVIVPRGWFLPVTPGTALVTVGGCVAADVHGKNHHVEGSFGEHVLEIELLIANGTKLRCSPSIHPDIFWATVGGMGLTGIITEVTFKLKKISSAHMWVQHYPAYHLEETLEKISDPQIEDLYSVAWIDCLSTGKGMGRSILMNAHHASSTADRKISLPKSYELRYSFSMPFHLPSCALNRCSIAAFNSAYFSIQKKKTTPYLATLQSYFYPLDSISNWNRMYGKKGFLQYQFVVPAKTAPNALPRIFAAIAASKKSSFLAVIKRFRKGNRGFLSFPMEGVTLALDLPYSDSLFPFLDKLDEIVLEAEGRLYLAKDARMHQEHFTKMYPQYPQWLEIKKRIDPSQLFQSDLSKRLNIGAPA